MKARFCLWLLCLALPLATVSAEDIRLIYFRMPPFADEINGKAKGSAVDLIRELTAGLPVTGAPMAMPLRRVEYALQNEKAIAIGLTRNARREKMNLVWVTELLHDDYYFVTLTGHPAVTGFDDARKLGHIACNLGSAPADILFEHGFDNLENAADLHSEAAKLHAGHVDGWFDIKSFIEGAWRGRGFDPAQLQWSPPMAKSSIWITASSQVDPAIIDTMRRRYDEIKSQGRLDPMLAKLVQ